MKENKYYVYLHRDLNGVVFYIGKGTRARVTSRTSRTDAWKAISNQGYTYQIVKSSMTNKEAVELEEQLIEVYRSTIVNSKSSKKIKELDFDYLNSIFYYDETSPSGLRWKVSRFKHKGARLFSPGDVAGNKKYLENGKPRCWRLKLEGKSLVIHRVIWALLNKNISSDLVIDHLDGNAFNNNIENLEEKTRADNARNRGYDNRTSDLMLGVIEKPDSNGGTQFRATWSDTNGDAQCKNFSIRKYGREEAYRLACEIRKLKIQEMIDFGHKYTERHIQN